MHISFKQGLDKFDSKDYPNLEPEEVDLVLNQAQEAFIKQRYGYNNTKNEAFEQTQKRIEDLHTLVKSVRLTPLLNSEKNINSNSVFVELPVDHWITIQELTNITYSDCNGNVSKEDVYTRPIQHNDYSKLINNPFAKPNINKVLRLTTLEGVELLHSTNSKVNSYKMRYIKKPIQMNSQSNPNVNCELPELVHQEIVNQAITIALENIESNRIKTFIQVTENRQE
jgi:hypothetical protein